MADKSLGADEWRAVLRRVSERLPHARTWHVTMIGGVAMALGFGGRRTTTDADVIDTAPEVFDAARAVAAEFGLSPEWMNRKAEECGYVVASAATDEGKVIFEAPSLEVWAPSTAHMLAMKVARFAGDTDVEDAKVLLDLLDHFADVEGLWTYIGGLVPLAYQDQARHNLSTLWEMSHEPA
jgi:hypothetical protein